MDRNDYADEVDRLRDLLRRAPRGVGADEPWLAWWREVSDYLGRVQ
jgi:hypothetical protein